MSEVAEMMLDGTLCQGCGVVNDSLCEAVNERTEGEWTPPGFPWTCDNCADSGQNDG